MRQPVFFQVAVLGASSSGKTSLLNRWMNNQYSEGYLPTMVLDRSLQKELPHLDNQDPIVLKFLEIAGNVNLAEKMHYLEKIEGFILTWDFQPETLAAVQNYLELIFQEKDAEKIQARKSMPFIFIRSKADKNLNPSEKNEIEKLIAKFEIKNHAIINISAKWSEGFEDLNAAVNKLFTQLALQEDEQFKKEWELVSSEGEYHEEDNKAPGCNLM